MPIIKKRFTVRSLFLLVMTVFALGVVSIISKSLKINKHSVGEKLINNAKADIPSYPSCSGSDACGSFDSCSEGGEGGGEGAEAS